MAPAADNTDASADPCRHEVNTLVPVDFWRFPVYVVDNAWLFIQSCEKLLADTVPTLFSYMDSTTLITAAVVCHGWRTLATCDVLWQRILKLEFSIEADSLAPPPRPLKRLWIQMRRT